MRSYKTVRSRSAICCRSPAPPGKPLRSYKGELDSTVAVFL